MGKVDVTAWNPSVVGIEVDDEEFDMRVYLLSGTMADDAWFAASDDEVAHLTYLPPRQKGQQLRVRVEVLPGRWTSDLLASFNGCEYPTATDALDAFRRLVATELPPEASDARSSD